MTVPTANGKAVGGSGWATPATSGDRQGSFAAWLPVAGWWCTLAPRPAHLRFAPLSPPNSRLAHTPHATGDQCQAATPGREQDALADWGHMPVALIPIRHVETGIDTGNGSSHAWRPAARCTVCTLLAASCNRPLHAGQLLLGRAVAPVQLVEVVLT